MARQQTGDFEGAKDSQPARAGIYGRRKAADAEGVRLHLRGFKDEHPADGGKRRGGGCGYGCGHTNSRAVESASSVVPLLQTAFCPGDEPAHRRDS